jgi:hypothetical protein
VNDPPTSQNISIAREATVRQILTFGMISCRMSFTHRLNADVSWAADTSRVMGMPSKHAASNFAAKAGQILTNAGTAR